MPLSEQQKNIVNPFAEQTYITLSPVDGEGNVPAYDYDDGRNRFVLDGIHESFLYFAEFPKAGLLLNREGIPDSLVGERRYVTVADLLAYSALYPQNGKVVEGNLEYLSDEEIRNKLEHLVERLEESSPAALYAYSSLTSRDAAQPENQSGMAKKISNLISIAPNHSPEYRNRLYSAFGLDPGIMISLEDNIDAQMELAGLSSTNSVFYNTDPTVDVFEWTNNCLPGKKKERVYFNPADDKFYYTLRTSYTSNDALDIGLISEDDPQRRQLGLYDESASQTIKERYERIAHIGIREILKFTGKDSNINRGHVSDTRPTIVEGGAEPLFLQPREEESPRENRAWDIVAFKDPRPASHWVCAVTISQKIMETLTSETSIGFQEYELTPLQKSKILIDPTKTPVLTHKPVIFTPPRLLRNSIATAALLEEYYDTTLSEGITPAVLRGIDLSEESQRVGSIVEVLGNFYTYNDLTIADNDQVQFYVDREYNLLYVVINGVLCARATGNRFLATLDPPPSTPNYTEYLLNAFSFQNSTTFSYIYHSDEIANSYFESNVETREPWLEFLQKYTYPALTLTPGDITEAQDRASNDPLLSIDLSGIRAAAQQLRTAKQVWNTATTIYDEEKKLTPEESAKAYNRAKKYLNVKKGFQTANCSTTMARITKHALNLEEVFNGKIAMRIKIRQLIFALKSEIMANETLRRECAPYMPYADVAINAEANPAQARRALEREINDQIFCGLDVLGGTLMDSILDPMVEEAFGAETGKYSSKQQNPAPLKIELKKIKGMNKSRASMAIWEKVINRLVRQFLTAMINSIAQDLINAMLGCGPAQNNAPSLPMPRHDYGRSSLRELVESATLDLTGIAGESLLFYTTEEVVDGEIVITERPIPEAMLLQLLADISAMTTPEEQEQLLYGEGENFLYAHISSALTDPRPTVKWPTGWVQPEYANESERHMATVRRIWDNNGETEAGEMILRYYIMETYPGFRKVQDLDKKIREFIFLIGQSLDLPDDEDSSESPLAAYCRDLKADVSSLGFQFSIEQLTAQQQMIVSEKIDKINAYCSFLRSLEGLELRLNQFLNSLPVMKFYEDLLKLIAALSLAFQSYLGEQLAARFAKPPDHLIELVYNFYSTKMGSEMFFQSYDFLRLGIPVSFVTSPKGMGPVPMDEQTNYVYRQFPTRKGGSGTNLGGNPEINQLVTGELVYALNNYLPLPFEEPGARNGEGARVPATLNQRVGSYGKRVGPLHIKDEIAREYLDPKRHPGADTQPEILDKQAGYNNKLCQDVIYPAYQHKEYSASTSYSGYYPRIFMRWNNSRVAPEDNPGVSIVTAFGDDPGNEFAFIPNFKNLDNPEYPVPDILASYVPLNRETSTEPGTEGYDVPVNYAYLMATPGVTGELIQNNGDYIFNGVKFPSLAQTTLEDSILSLVNPFMFGIQGRIGHNPEYLTSTGVKNVDRSGRALDCVVLGNYTVKIDETLDRGFASPVARRRMTKYLQGTNVFPFKENDDECVSADDIYIAKSWVTVLQARLQRFFINVLPLGTVYTQWGSLGTIELISNYMTRKIITELSDRALLGKIYSKFDLIDKVYGGYPEEMPQVFFNPSDTPQQKLHTTVKALMRKMLENIGRLSEYNTIHRGAYEDWDFGEHLQTNIQLQRYRKAVGRFFGYLNIHLETQTFGLSAAEANACAAEIGRSLITYEDPPPRGDNEAADPEEEWHRARLTDTGITAAQYYFPVPLLIGQALIFYDHSVRPSERYSETQSKLLFETAIADDAFLTALSGQMVDRFTAQYRGFPVAVMQWDQTNHITYYNRSEVEARIRVLDEEMANFQEELQSRQILYTPQQLVDISRVGTLKQSFSESGFFRSPGLRFADNRWVHRILPTDDSEHSKLTRAMFSQGNFDIVRDKLEAWFVNDFDPVFMTPAPGQDLHDSLTNYASNWITNQYTSYASGLSGFIPTWEEWTLRGYRGATGPSITDATGHYYELLGSVFDKMGTAGWNKGGLVSVTLEPEYNGIYDEWARADEIFQIKVVEYQPNLQRDFLSFLGYQYNYSRRFQADLLNEKMILEALLT